MSNNPRRFWLLVSVCSVLGVVVGGTTSHAAINQCLDAEIPSHECLTQDPVMKTLEGIGMGLFVSTGAALGATWQTWQKD